MKILAIIALVVTSTLAFADCNEKALIDDMVSQLSNPSQKTSNVKVGAKITPYGTLVTYSFDSSLNPWTVSMSGYVKYDEQCNRMEGDGVVVYKAH